MTDSLTIDMLKCARCGKCRSLCPSFKSGESKWETSNARGRVLMSLGLKQKKIPVTEQLISDIYSCFICKSCSELCPSDVDVSKIVEATRNEIYNQGLLPSPINLLLSNLDESRNIFNLDQDDRLLWDTNVEELVDSHLNVKADVGFFIGCLASFKGTLATIPEALVLLSDHLGIDFTLLGEDEWCCGNPYFIAGNSGSITKEFAEHNIQKMSDLNVKTVVTPCPGCYRVWSSLYPKIHGKLPFKIQHSSQFLAQLIANRTLKIKQPLPINATYQDPCELGRHCREFEAPRVVLSSIPALTLIELENTKENAECCGGGGLAKALHPSLAINQGQNKIQQFHQKEIKLLVTSCPSCYENYQNSLESCQIPIKVKDINELIAEQLNLL